MRASLAPCILATVLAATAAADRIAMPDKIELSGQKVEILEVHPDDIVVRVAYGEITIPRQRVIDMEIDFEARLQSLKRQGKDTPRALFKLGKVCDAVDEPEQALQAYQRAAADDKVPEDVLLPLAGELERHGAWQAAAQTYNRYLKLDPENAAVKAKAEAALEKAKDEQPELAMGGPDTPGQIEITPAPLPEKPRPRRPAEPQPAQPGEEKPLPAEPEPLEPEPAEPQPEPEPKEPEGPQVEEGLEADPGWSTEAWGSTVEVSVGVPEGGAQDKMLQVFLAGAEKDKACVMLEDDFDLSKKETFEFDVHNFADQTLTIAVAFITRPGWEFYESIPKTVLPKGNEARHISLDLTGNRFKTARTKWRFKSELENRDQIIKVYFLLYTKITGKWVFFNNIRFEPTEEEAAEGAAPAAPAAGAQEGPAEAEPAPAVEPEPAPAPKKAEPAPAENE
jgi:hypothetical protein